MKTLTKYASAAAALAVGLSVASAAGGAGAATWGIQLRGIVPLICNVNLNAQGNQSNGASKKIHLGQLSEVCNNGNGYTVYATTPAGVSGTFLVGNQAVPVQSSGVTAIDSSATAAVTKQQLDFEPAAGGQVPATISLSVVAH